jgi:hypothetical protein
MVEILKYPRTRHIEGSGLQKGDSSDYVPFLLLKDKFLVVEEKVDGANTGISFSENGDLWLQCRGHYLTGGPREEQFALFKPWAQTHQSWLWERLGTRYILYGEWLYAKHTVFYDALPHYFLEFDIWDRESETFLSTERRHEMLAGGPVLSVPVLQTGQFTSLKGITALVQHSLYKSKNWREKITMKGTETDDSDFSEGLYVKWEENGVVKGRYKWVRPDFVQAILDSNTHWMARQIVPNVLAEGVSLW